MSSRDHRDGGGQSAIRKATRQYQRYVPLRPSILHSSPLCRAVVLLVIRHKSAKLSALKLPKNCGAAYHASYSMSITIRVPVLSVHHKLSQANGQLSAGDWLNQDD